MFELTAQDYKDAAARLARLRGEALDWLNRRFQDVRDEEISDQVARDIAVIREWERDCRYCTDIRRCRHSRAVLTIREEGTRDGFRVFYTRAHTCDACVSYMESMGMNKKQGRRQ